MVEDGNRRGSATKEGSGDAPDARASNADAGATAAKAPSNTQTAKGRPPSRRWPRSFGVWGLRVTGACVVFYIALVGHLAIQELQRRDTVLKMFNARDAELSAALALLGSSTDQEATTQRANLRDEQSKTRQLRDRLTALIVVGARAPDGSLDGRLVVIMCEWLKARNSTPDQSCTQIKSGPAGDDSFSSQIREVAALFALKRAAEKRSSGDVFGILIFIAAIGGALVRVYLPGSREADAFWTVMRALGGGIVCYLVITGGSFPFADVPSVSVTAPGTGALFGFLAGMFSTKVFNVLSDVVDKFFDRLKATPDEPTNENRPEPPSA